MVGAGHHFAMGKVGSGGLPYVVRATCFEIRASCFESGGFGYGIRAPAFVGSKYVFVHTGHCVSLK